MCYSDMIWGVFYKVMQGSMLIPRSEYSDISPNLLRDAMDFDNPLRERYEVYVPENGPSTRPHRYSLAMYSLITTAVQSRDVNDIMERLQDSWTNIIGKTWISFFLQ